MAEPALELQTSRVDRPAFTIDGTRYEMRAPEEMGIAELIRQRQLKRYVDSCFAKADDDEKPGEREFRDDLTDSEYEQYLKSIYALANLTMVDVPQDVVEALPFKALTAFVDKYNELFNEAPASSGDDAASPTTD